MEGRALFFTAELCRLITDRCVPFARNCLISSGYAGDDAFWNRLGTQGVYLGNSMFLCSASGRVADGFHDRNFHNWLAAWERLPESERRPGSIKVGERGPYRESVRNPRPPAGGLIVKSYTRALQRDTEGEFSAPKTLSLGISKTVIKAEPNRDYLWLTADDWASLIPTRPKPGDAHTVPRRIRDRFFRFHLVDGACCLPGFWESKHIRSGGLTLTVEKVLPNEICMRLDGSATLGSSQRIVEFQISGILNYDRTRKAVARFDAVALTTSPWHKDTATGELMPVAIAFTLADPTSPADQRPPYRIWYDQDGQQDYFGRPG